MTAPHPGKSREDCIEYHNRLAEAGYTVVNLQGWPANPHEGCWVRLGNDDSTVAAVILIPNSDGSFDVALAGTLNPGPVKQP
jgi:hypothetical protein